MEKHLPTHAGGVVVRQQNGEPEVMMVTAKKKNNVWVFPKGHLFKNEGHGECAVREIWEESGWLTRVVLPITTVAHKTKKEKKIVKYYLMQPEDQIIEPGEVSEEGRTVKWVSFKEALQLIDKDANDLRDVLFLAYARINSLK